MAVLLVQPRLKILREETPFHKGSQRCGNEYADCQHCANCQQAITSQLQGDFVGELLPELSAEQKGERNQKKGREQCREYVFHEWGEDQASKESQNDAGN